jgi:hypothetical protein
MVEYRGAVRFGAFGEQGIEPGGGSGGESGVVQES